MNSHPSPRWPRPTSTAELALLNAASPLTWASEADVCQDGKPYSADQAAPAGFCPSARCTPARARPPACAPDTSPASRAPACCSPRREARPSQTNARGPPARQPETDESFRPWVHDGGPRRVASCGSIEPARDLRGLAFGHARLGLMRWIAESGAPGAGHPLGTAEHGTSGSGPKESGTFLLASS